MPIGVISGSFAVSDRGPSPLCPGWSCSQTTMPSDHSGEQPGAEPLRPTALRFRGPPPMIGQMRGPDFLPPTKFRYVENGSAKVRDGC
jgi:hypothetical protein